MINNSRLCIRLDIITQHFRWLFSGNAALWYYLIGEIRTKLPIKISTFSLFPEHVFTSHTYTDKHKVYHEEALDKPSVSENK